MCMVSGYRGLLLCQAFQNGVGYAISVLELADAVEQCPIVALHHDGL